MAYCNLRRAPRIFRLDRIVELVDLSTGEFMPNPAGFARRIVNGRERAPRMRAVAGRRSGLS
jgi:predicted DNA-binding transcriptional regulator YafY